jgi:hypothetical protein
MPETNGHDGKHRAAHEAATRNSIQLRMPVIGAMTLPPPQHLAFYGGLAALAAVEIIEWPVAVALGIGKALADQHSNHALEDFGEALEAGA